MPWHASSIFVRVRSPIRVKVKGFLIQKPRKDLKLEAQTMSGGKNRHVCGSVYHKPEEELARQFMLVKSQTALMGEDTSIKSTLVGP